MKKRTFLQCLLAALGSAIAPPIAFGGSDPIDFDPTKHYGNWVILDDSWEDDRGFISEENRLKVERVLVTDARRTLPPGTEFSVIISPRTGNGCGDVWDDFTTMAWVYPARRDRFTGGLGVLAKA